FGIGYKYTSAGVSGLSSLASDDQVTEKNMPGPVYSYRIAITCINNRFSISVRGNDNRKFRTPGIEQIQFKRSPKNISCLQINCITGIELQFANRFKCPPGFIDRPG